MRPSQIAQLPEAEVRDAFLHLMNTREGTGPEDAAILLQMRGEEMADWLLSDYPTLRQALCAQNAALASSAYVLVVKYLAPEAAPDFLAQVKANGDRDVAVTLANARPDLAEAFAKARIDVQPRRAALVR